MSVKVTGLNNLLYKLEKLSRQDAVAPALVAAVNAGGQLIFDAVEENTPARTDKWTEGSTALKPGELRENLDLEKDFDGERGNPRAIVRFTGKVNRVARWVEKGHRLVHGGQSKVLKSGKTRGPGQETGFVPGSHFFASAVEGKSEEVREVVRAKLREEIAKIVK